MVNIDPFFYEHSLTLFKFEKNVILHIQDGRNTVANIEQGAVSGSHFQNHTCGSMFSVQHSEKLHNFGQFLICKSLHNIETGPERIMTGFHVSTVARLTTLWS